MLCGAAWRYTGRRGGPGGGQTGGPGVEWVRQERLCGLDLGAATRVHLLPGRYAAGMCHGHGRYIARHGRYIACHGHYMPWPLNCTTAIAICLVATCLTAFVWPKILYWYRV